MKRGVIYYNTGNSCALRLLVSLHSLRRYYDGPVTILSEGEESHRFCHRIGTALKAEVIEWDCGVPVGKHRVYLAKTCYHLGTPYELTVALDADTLVVGRIDELFDIAEQAEFCVAQLGSWRSSGRTIATRIRRWESSLPDDMAAALAFGPAINCGVVAFRKDSRFYADWLRLALPGRETFIPDEVCCQVVLHRYPHLVLDGKWNRSCKHDDPDLPDTRIIHYHGRKHCRPGLPWHGGTWVAEYDKAVAGNVGSAAEWQPAGDRMMRRFHRWRREKSPVECRPPLTIPKKTVTAIMVTGHRKGRRAFAMNAVDCFLRQNYGACDLLVINTGASLEISKANVREVCLDQGAMTLGDLRNLGLEEARGEFVIQWDDDDWHHPDRIAAQIEFSDDGEPCLLGEQIRHSFTTRRSFVAVIGSGIHGTILHRRDCTPRYPSLARGEDAVFTESFSKHGILHGKPHLYVRFYHGMNTWHERKIMHFKGHKLGPRTRRFLRKTVLPLYRNCVEAPAIS